MPLLGFQARFADAVESGEKRQTIRAYRKDGRDPKVGDRLYLYTGLRTKKSRKLGEGIVVSVRPIRIGTDGNLTIGRFDRHGRVVELQGYDIGWCTRIARADGFGHIGELRRWFEKTHGLPFAGLLIRWRPA